MSCIRWWLNHEVTHSYFEFVFGAHLTKISLESISGAKRSKQLDEKSIKAELVADCRHLMAAVQFVKMYKCFNSVKALPKMSRK